MTGWCSRGVSQLGLEGRTWLVVDIETTGLNAKQDQIVELAALLVDTGGQLHERVEWDATETADVSDVIDTLVQMAQHEAVVVGHNVAFDLEFLSRAIGRTIDCRWLCTMRICGGRGSLDQVARRLKIAPVARHTARGDAVTTARVLVALIESAQRRGATTVAGLATVAPIVMPEARDDDGAGWSGVVEALDRVVPVPFVDAGQRACVAAAIAAAASGELGPVGASERRELIEAFRSANVTALAAELILGEHGIPATCGQISGDT